VVENLEQLKKPSPVARFYHAGHYESADIEAAVAGSPGRALVEFSGNMGERIGPQALPAWIDFHRALITRESTVYQPAFRSGLMARSSGQPGTIADAGHPVERELEDIFPLLQILFHKNKLIPKNPRVILR
jgi:hypothetical protein